MTIKLTSKQLEVIIINLLEWESYGWAGPCELLRGMLSSIEDVPEDMQEPFQKFLRIPKRDANLGEFSK